MDLHQLQGVHYQNTIYLVNIPSNAYMSHELFTDRSILNTYIEYKWHHCFHNGYLNRGYFHDFCGKSYSFCLGGTFIGGRNNSCRGSFFVNLKGVELRVVVGQNV